MNFYRISSMFHHQNPNRHCLNYLIGLLLGSILIFQSCAQPTFDEYLEALYSETVPLMQPSELDSLRDKGEKVYLLDTRSRKEYEVSHIPGARWVGYDAFKKEQLDDIPKSGKVVVYCTVGYRSEKIGEKLQELGYQNVYNVYGSILKWKNEGYQVVNEGQETEKVHAYSQKYAKWLKNGEAVLE